MKKIFFSAVAFVLSVSALAFDVQWQLFRPGDYSAEFEKGNKCVTVTVTKLNESKQPATLLGRFNGKFDLTAGDVILKITPVKAVPVTVVPCLESRGGALFPNEGIFKKEQSILFTLKQLIKGTFTPNTPKPSDIRLLRLKIHGMKKGDVFKWKIADPEIVAPTVAPQCALPVPEGTVNDTTVSFAELKKSIKPVKIPIYLMEYHIWYENAFTADGKLCFSHWREGTNPTDIDIAPPFGAWKRDIGSCGMPLPGYYHSPSKDIQRWQISCMKNAGVDGAFVQVFTSLDGEWFDHRIKVFESALDIAAEKGFKLGIHDEVHFRSAISQKPDVCARRWAKLVRKYGDHPGFLKIDGNPAIQFQFWGNWKNRISDEDAIKMMKKSEELAGRKIHFIPMKTFSDKSCKAMPSGYSVVLSANSNMLNVNVKKSFREGKNDWSLWQARMDKVKEKMQILRKGKVKPWLWGYGLFNNSCYAAPDCRWIDSDSGRSLIKFIDMTAAANPDAILISSWNDWRENTALEPGFTRDDCNQDPYLYCRILAAFKGREFKVPALPPAEAVDKLLWSRLYNIDRTPPEITSAVCHPLDPAVLIHAYDAESTLVKAKLLRYGSNFIRFGKDAAAKNAVMSTPDPAKEVDISAKAMAQVIFEKVSFTVDDVPWLFISYTDTAAGNIRISFKSSPERHFDTALNELKIPTYGSGKVCAELIPVRRWQRSSGNTAQLVFSFKPAFDRKSKKFIEKPDASIKLNSLALITDISEGVDGRASAPGERYGETFRFNGVAAEGKSEDWVFVMVQDKCGNWSRPAAINLAGQHQMHLTHMKLYR